jgi:hypothetical protein
MMAKLCFPFCSMRGYTVSVFVEAGEMRDFMRERD